MVKKAYTPEQIINNLREAEVHLSQGRLTPIGKPISQQQPAASPLKPPPMPTR